MAVSHIFKVLFVNQGKVYEIYARKVGHGTGLFGFIEVEELVFGERSSVVGPSDAQRTTIGCCPIPSVMSQPTTPASASARGPISSKI